MVAFACTTCNGMMGALDPAIQQEIVDRDLHTTAVLSGNRNFDGRIHPMPGKPFWLRHRWSWPMRLLAPCADIENDVLERLQAAKSSQDIWRR